MNPQLIHPTHPTIFIPSYRHRSKRYTRKHPTAKSSGSAGTAGVAAEEATLPLDGVGETKAERGEAKKEAKQNDAERSADAASEPCSHRGSALAGISAGCSRFPADSRGFTAFRGQCFPGKSSAS